MILTKTISLRYSPQEIAEQINFKTELAKHIKITHTNAGFFGALQMLVNRSYQPEYKHWTNLMPVYNNPALARALYANMASFIESVGANKVVGIASRGLPLAGVVALYNKLPYAIIGKYGKMPGVKLISPYFENNYYHEKTLLEMRADHVGRGDRVVVLDDKIYSGVQMSAAIDVIRAAGAKVVGVTTPVYFENEVKDRPSKILQKIKSYYPLTISKDGARQYLKSIGDSFEIKESSITEYTEDQLKSAIRIFRSFPKSGIHWTDFSGIQLNPDMFRYVIYKLATALRDDKGVDVNVVVSAAVRGNDFGAGVADFLGARHVLAVKKREYEDEPMKRQGYEMEYGKSEICIANGYIKPTDKVLIIDDITATGGTMEAMVKLVRNHFGATVSGAATLIGLTELMHKSAPWRRVFADGKDPVPHYSFLNYSFKELDELGLMHEEERGTVP